MILRPPASACLGSLLEIQTFKAHTRPTESEFNFEKHWLNQLPNSEGENSGPSNGGFCVELKTGS